ncbi:MAG: PqiC family protein [Methyloprofundus sp.]|nr:PqiC family protein [Methyloprofundus sp.]
MKRIILYTMIYCLSACTSSPKVDNYILYADPINELKTESESSPKVFLKPLIFPEYLDRPQIVIRTDKGQLEIQEFKRWAEPLKSSFLRVFKQSMQQQGVNISSYKQFRQEKFDYQLSLNVLHFEMNQEKKADLMVHWVLLNSQNNQVIASHIEAITLAIKGEDFASKIRTQSQLIKLLAARLATQIFDK